MPWSGGALCCKRKENDGRGAGAGGISIMSRGPHRSGWSWMLSLALMGPGMNTATAETVGAPESAFSLEAVRWQFRVLVVSAPDSSDERLHTQLEAVEASRADFEERNLLLVTLFDGAGSVAGEQPLTREQADRVRAALAIDQSAFAVRLIGKDGGIKLRKSTVVSMGDIYGLIDTMPMRRSEMER